jgi:FAD binding domain
MFKQTLYSTLSANREMLLHQTILFIAGLAGTWATPSCKTSPSSISASAWSSLNASVSGALLSTAEIGVPGGICQQGQPNYNETLCSTLQSDWFTSWDPVVTHPVHNAYQNWNNDSCWPFPTAGLSCNPLVGYPTYVVNATTTSQVSAAVNFARDNNVRLIVKASGHDFRGRSVAGNSLSIWVKNILGLEFHDSFAPTRNCGYGKGFSAITWAAGEDAWTRQNFAHSNGMMINVGGGPTVGGGYAYGGGHSIISSTRGLSADNILEVNIVTPDGNLVTANACENEDLFWAVRGGGGSTFGVVMNVTERVYPQTPLAFIGMVILGLDATSTSGFYEAAATFLNQFPLLGDEGLMTYSFLSSGNATTPPQFISGFIGINKTVDETLALLEPIASTINSTYAGNVIVYTNGSSFDTLFDWWSTSLDDNGSSTPIGIDVLIGSRLLDKAALTHPDLSQLLPELGQAGASFFLVSGPGVHQHAADFDSVHPSWRTSYVHCGEYFVTVMLQ